MAERLKRNKALQIKPKANLIDSDRQLAYPVKMTRQLRIALHLTQEQLANEIGVSLRTIQRYETGGKASSGARKAIEAWLQAVQWQAIMAGKSI